jgi:hypothetical protein
MLAETMKETGIGGLPANPAALHTPNNPSSSGDISMELGMQMPSEEQLLAYAESSVASLFETLKHQQEGAEIVGNILAIDNRQP